MCPSRASPKGEHLFAPVAQDQIAFAECAPSDDLDSIDAINLTEEQQAILNGIPDRMFRQTVRDFFVNQQFRKDYWVKGLAA